MKKDIAYYLSKGFDLKTATYFANGRKTIIAVTANDDFTLTLKFDNEELRIYDVKPLIEPNTIFEFFSNIENFKRVYIDDCHCVSWDIDPNIDSNIVWNNKIDLCPDSCYMDSFPLTGGIKNV